MGASEPERLPMRVLITGGAGTLGSNLVDRLLPQGRAILVIDNFATGARGNLPAAPGLEVVEGSIADAALVDAAFDRFAPTHVIHAAASYKDPDDWAADAETNVAGAIHVARAALRAKVRRFVNLQTALCFGRPDVVPIPADHPQRPFTSYGVSKSAGEFYLAMSGLPMVSLRLANVTGPRLAIGPIPTFYKRLKEGKPCFCSDTVRDFLDMEDFLALMDRVLENEAATGCFNASTGAGNTIKEVYDAVSGYLGVVPDREVPIVPPGDDDVPAVVLDPGETERVFGWKAKVGFTETIHRMLRWYDRHGVTAVYSHLRPGVSQ